jgi:hypothetical protein
VSEDVKPRTMYKEIEQDENVARGCVKVIEIIAYDPVGKKRNEDDTKDVIIERGRAPYFCQDAEDELIFAENNPDARTEKFNVQLLKSTAIKYLNAPENMRQFTRKAAKV